MSLLAREAAKRLAEAAAAAFVAVLAERAATAVWCRLAGDDDDE